MTKIKVNHPGDCTFQVFDRYIMTARAALYSETRAASIYKGRAFLCLEGFAHQPVAATEQVSLVRLEIETFRP